jgi:hypothetical protein
VEIVDAILDERNKHAKKLAFSRDRYGRFVFDIATPACRAAMQKRLLFYQRYRLDDLPVHTSCTSVVYFAMDCRAATNAAQERRVAIKFMQKRDHFDREVVAHGRFQEADSRDYVLGLLECHDGDADVVFARCAEECGLGRYCVVMERADR